MLPKRPHKRKIRQVIKILLFCCGLFILSSACLFIFFLIPFFHRHPLVSPLSRQQQVAKAPTATTDVTQAVAIALLKYNMQVKSVTMASASAIMVEEKNGQMLVFSSDKKLDQQIASLQLIIDRLTIEGKRFSRIDFRFDNPVVTF